MALVPIAVGGNKLGTRWRPCQSHKPGSQVCLSRCRLKLFRKASFYFAPVVGTPQEHRAIVRLGGNELVSRIPGDAFHHPMMASQASKEAPVCSDPLIIIPMLCAQLYTPDAYGIVH